MDSVTQGGNWLNGHFKFILKEPTGMPQQRWINEVPNEGLIRYRVLFNTERLLVTSPKALGEVLVQRNYDFVKPAQLRQAIGRILGIGILVAEGEEHKVHTAFNLI